MKAIKEELKVAEDFTKSLDFEYLSMLQKESIRTRATELLKWTSDHPYLHNFINIILTIVLIATDIYVLTRITHDPVFSWTRLAALSILHGIIMYNIVSFALHEGAAHSLIIKVKGPMTKVLNWMSKNMCRLYFGDPTYYYSHHRYHHSGFTTETDGAFTNAVNPKRFYKSLLPLASVMNYNDFRIHTGLEFTTSRIISESLSFLYRGIIAWPLIAQKNVSGFIFFVGVIFFGTWFAFILDRLRETTEHNFMPKEKDNGTRDFGLGFWGLLVGGGFWGQPCHMSHHLAPALPWYQQVRLHFFIKKILSEKQKKDFLLEPIFGYPKLLFTVLKNKNKF